MRLYLQVAIWQAKLTAFFIVFILMPVQHDVSDSKKSKLTD